MEKEDRRIFFERINTRVVLAPGPVISIDKRPKNTVTKRKNQNENDHQHAAGLGRNIC
jgi:hypothetical protein